MFHVPSHVCSLFSVLTVFQKREEKKIHTLSRIDLMSSLFCFMALLPDCELWCELRCELSCMKFFFPAAPVKDFWDSLGEAWNKNIFYVKSWKGGREEGDDDHHHRQRRRHQQQHRHSIHCRRRRIGIMIRERCVERMETELFCTTAARFRVLGYWLCWLLDLNWGKERGNKAS